MGLIMVVCEAVAKICDLEQFDGIRVGMFGCDGRELLDHAAWLLENKRIP